MIFIHELWIAARAVMSIDGCESVSRRNSFENSFIYIMAAAIENIHLGWFYIRMYLHILTLKTSVNERYVFCCTLTGNHRGKLRWARFYNLVIVKVNGNMAAWLCVCKLALKQCYTS